MKIFNRIMLILCTLIFLVSLSMGIYFLIKFESATAAGGNVLTDEFLRTDYVSSIYSTRFNINFVSAFFAFLGGLYVILNPLIRKHYERMPYYLSRRFRSRLVVVPLCFVLLACSFLSTSFFHPKVDLNADPEIVICEVESKYREGLRRKIRYYVVYTNGISERVSLYEYNKIEPGDYYYRVYFGDQCVKTYDGSEYSLPQ